MHARPRGATSLLMGLSLATCPMIASIARTDTLPEEALFGDWIPAAVEITGIAQFPDHVFYLYPASCTEEQAQIENDGLPDAPWEYEPQKPGDTDWTVLTDGPLTSWVGKNAPCKASKIHAIARDLAAGLDLAKMTPQARYDFFDGDPRLFRADFVFMNNPLYGPRGTKVRSVREVVRVLRITTEEVRAVLQSSTYRFDDGTEQTLLLSHTRRPELPFRPMKPEKLAKYAETHAKWEARQPLAPPPAPRLPEGAEEALAAMSTTGDTTDAAGTTGPASTGTTAATSTGTTGPASTGTTAADDATGAPPPIAAAGPATPPPAPAPATPPIPAPPEPDPETLSEAPASPSRWPLGAVAGAIALAAAITLARRRR